MKQLLTLGAIFLLLGCGSKKSKIAELKIAGGTAHIGVMEIVAANLMTKNPALKISVAGGGSGLGIKQVGEGIVDIGNSGRDLKPTEIEQYGLVPHKIAIDAIGVIVNPESQVGDLTLEQVQGIYAGTILNWSEVGGVDAPISIYTRDPESGTRATFWKLALRKGEISENALFVKSNGDMKVNVGRDKNAIGFMSVGNTDESVKTLAINGVNPTTENIQNGTYTVQRYLYSVTKGEATGMAKLFIDALLSAEGQAIVKQKNFISVK